MAIFQQLVKEYEDLKNEIRELQRTCEIQRAEYAKLRAQNLKLKNAIKHVVESMKDFLQAVLEEASEMGVEVKDEGQEIAGAEM